MTNINKLVLLQILYRLGLHDSTNQTFFAIDCYIDYFVDY